MSKWQDSWKAFEAKLPKDEQLEADLLELFEDRRSELLLEAILQLGKKRNILIPMGYVLGGRLSGCYVNYNSKKGLFDYIQYPVRGKRGGGPYAKRIELK